MASQVRLVGGNFQDLEGGPLALGYFTMRLNQDESVNDSQVCSGIITKVYLDSTGNCVYGQYVWGNDVMSPINSYYTVTVYSAEGQIVWGPNNQQVTGSGTFDVGTWTPNSVISWSPALQQPLLLEINGTTASSQTVQNLVNSASVTVTDEGSGEISFAASGGGSSSGSNVSTLPWNFWERGGSSTLAEAGTYCQVMFADSIVASPSSWKVQIDVTSAFTYHITEMFILRTLKGSLATVDITPITFGGSAIPLFSTTGIKTSDAISLAIDAAHDYYFVFQGTFGGTGTIASNDSGGSYMYTSYAGNPNTGGLSTLWATSVGNGGGFGAAFPLGFGPYFLTGWNAA